MIPPFLYSSFFQIHQCSPPLLLKRPLSQIETLVAITRIKETRLFIRGGNKETHKLPSPDYEVRYSRRNRRIPRPREQRTIDAGSPPINHRQNGPSELHNYRAIISSTGAPLPGSNGIMELEVCLGGVGLR